MFPSVFPSLGEIKAYWVTVNSDPDIAFPAGTVLHFDAFDQVELRNKSKVVFAPFSHDAGGHPVPEPSSLALLVLGALWLRRIVRPVY